MRNDGDEFWHRENFSYIYVVENFGMAKFIFYTTSHGYGREEIKKYFSGKKNVKIIDELEIEDAAAKKMLSVDSKMETGSVMRKFFTMRDEMKKKISKKYNKKGNVVIVFSTSVFRVGEKGSLGMFISESPKKYFEMHSGHTDYGKKILEKVMNGVGKNMPRWKLMFLMGCEYGLFPTKVSDMQKNEKKMISGAKKMGYKILPVQKVIDEMEKLIGK